MMHLTSIYVGITLEADEEKNHICRVYVTRPFLFTFLIRRHRGLIPQLYSISLFIPLILTEKDFS